MLPALVGLSNAVHDLCVAREIPSSGSVNISSQSTLLCPLHNNVNLLYSMNLTAQQSMCFDYA